MEESKKYELEELIEKLEGYRGRHTELITVFVPAGAILTHTTKQLENEKGTATNIKSTSTRKNVINALERAIRKLKEIHPELNDKQLEKELVPLSGEEVGIKTLKKRKRL